MTRTYKTIYATLAAAIVSIMLANAAMAGKHLSRSIDDLTWVKGGPGLQFALLWGDWKKGNYGMVGTGSGARPFAERKWEPVPPNCLERLRRSK